MSPETTCPRKCIRRNRSRAMTEIMIYKWRGSEQLLYSIQFFTLSEMAYAKAENSIMSRQENFNLCVHIFTIIICLLLFEVIIINF